jgi:hypothetical protein
MSKGRLCLPLILVLGACGHVEKPVAGRNRALQGRAVPQAEPPALTPAPEAAPGAAKVLGRDAAGCTWVESEGLVTVGDRESRHQARAAAVEEARKAAMRDFLGVDVRSRFMDFQQEGLRDQARLTEDILQTTRNGRILKEQVVKDEYRDLPGCQACRYFVLLRSCLVQSDSSADKDFQVELGLSRTRFVAGDKAVLTVTPNRDCSLYLYDVGMDWQTWMIVPSADVPEVRVKAGETWTYPDAKGRDLVAEMPDEKSDVSAETIRVVCAKTPVPEKVWNPKAGGYLGVLQRLNASRLDWAEDAQAFTIYRK